eukprot:6232988-Prymnesium_polylepis.1
MCDARWWQNGTWVLGRTAVGTASPSDHSSAPHRAVASPHALTAHAPHPQRSASGNRLQGSGPYLRLQVHSTHARCEKSAFRVTLG